MDQDSAQELEWADAGEAVLLRELTRQQQQMAEQLAADPAGLFGDEISDADRGFLERSEAVDAFRRIVPDVGGSFRSRQRMASSDGWMTRWRSLPRGGSRPSSS